MARLGSSRLPGKVLAEIGGKPLLRLVVERAGRALSPGPEAQNPQSGYNEQGARGPDDPRPGLAGLVLATTDRPEDDALEEAARALELPVFRGSSDDVASRLLQALPPDATHFLRLNGDSPFPDPDLILQGLQLAAESGADFVTNIPGRTYPYGVSVEILRLDHYRRLMGSVTDPALREHVTSALFNSGETVVRSLPAGDFSGVRMVVDTREDLEETRRVATLLGPDVVSAPYTRVAPLYIRVRASGADTA